MAITSTSLLIFDKKDLILRDFLRDINKNSSDSIAVRELMLKMNVQVDYLLKCSEFKRFKKPLEEIKQQIHLQLNQVKKRKSSDSPITCNFDLAGINKISNIFFHRISLGNLDHLPETIQHMLMGYLSAKDLSTLSTVSQACKSLGDLESGWKISTTLFELTEKEITTAGSHKKALKAAYLNFYGSLLRRLSISDYYIPHNPDAENKFNEMLSHTKSIERIRHVIKDHKTHYARFEVLDLSDCNLTYLPSDIWKYFENIKELKLNKNRLKFIPAEIAELSNLEYLICSDNQLKEIPNIFDKLKKINRLQLDNNLFEAIPKSVFSLKKEALISFSFMPSLSQVSLKEFQDIRQDLKIECYKLPEDKPDDSPLPLGLRRTPKAFFLFHCCCKEKVDLFKS